MIQSTSVHLHDIIKDDYPTEDVDISFVKKVETYSLHDVLPMYNVCCLSNFTYFMQKDFIPLAYFQVDGIEYVLYQKIDEFVFCQPRLKYNKPTVA